MFPGLELDGCYKYFDYILSQNGFPFNLPPSAETVAYPSEF